MTKEGRFLPPGEHKNDPWNKEIDPVLWALDKLKTDLLWMSEFHATYLARRENSPEEAEKELRRFKHAEDGAWDHIRRLAQLILDGHTVDASKKVPQDLTGDPYWLSDPDEA